MTLGEARRLLDAQARTRLDQRRFGWTVDDAIATKMVLSELRRIEEDPATLHNAALQEAYGRR